jgi:ComF family protein
VCDTEVKKADIQYIDLIFSSYYYRGIIRKLILDFKFKNQKYLCRFLASAIAKAMKNFTNETTVDYIVYVPISFRRYMERGYNQSYLIAKTISSELHIPIIKYNLIKIKHNKRQSELGIKMRNANTKGVYKVLNSKRFNNKSILLIDDIFTTGNTVMECSRVLKHSGATKIIVATVAKADGIFKN